MSMDLYNSVMKSYNEEDYYSELELSERILLKRLVFTENSSLSNQQKGDLLKKIIISNLNNTESLNKINENVGYLEHNKILEKKYIDFLNYKIAFIDSKSSNSISEDKNLLDIYKKYENDSDFEKLFLILDDIAEYKHPVSKNDEIENINSQKVENDSSQETKNERSQEAENERSQETKNERSQEAENESTLIRDQDYWLKELNQILSEKRYQNENIIDKYNPNAIKKAAMALFKKDKEEEEENKNLEEVWGNKIYKVNDTGKKDCIIEMPIITKSVIMKKMPDSDDPSENEEKYKIMALAAKSRGIKKPTINVKESSPENRREFATQTLIQLINVGYDVNDISVPRDLEHIKEKFAITQGITETSELNETQKLVNNQMGDDRSQNVEHEQKEESNEFNDGYQKDDILKSSSLGGDNKQNSYSQPNSDGQGHEHDTSHESHGYSQPNSDGQGHEHDTSHESQGYSQPENQSQEVPETTKIGMLLALSENRARDDNNIYKTSLENTMNKYNFNSKDNLKSANFYKSLNNEFADIYFKGLVEEITLFKDFLKGSEDSLEAINVKDSKLNKDTAKHLNTLISKLGMEIPEEQFSENLKSMLSGELPNENLKIKSIKGFDVNEKNNIKRKYKV